jgi:hypothetical protein
MGEVGGRAWILQEATEIAKAEGLVIEKPTWAIDTKGGTSPSEQRLCFNHKDKKHSVLFSDAEIDDCAEPAYESERSIVSQRLRETFRRLKRETK